jgi:hypothetical protein
MYRFGSPSGLTYGSEKPGHPDFKCRAFKGGGRHRGYSSSARFPARTLCDPKFSLGIIA